MRPGHMSTHLVLERPSIKLLSDVLSQNPYRPPVKVGPVDLIACQGTIKCREPCLNRGSTGLKRPTSCFNVQWRH